MDLSPEPHKCIISFDKKVSASVVQSLKHKRIAFWRERAKFDIVIAVANLFFSNEIYPLDFIKFDDLGCHHSKVERPGGGWGLWIGSYCYHPSDVYAEVGACQWVYL
jgi:hypothetical protein